MAAVRAVPNPYTSVEAAIAAANPGDTIFIDPGYWGSTITVNKPVHLKGNTTNPDVDKVRFSGYSIGGVGYATIHFNFTYNPAVPTILVEGLAIEGFFSSTYAKYGASVDLNAGNTQFIFNRCILEPPEGVSNIYYTYLAELCHTYTGGMCNVRFVNCTRRKSTGSGNSPMIPKFRFVTNPASSIAIEKCYFVDAYPVVYDVDTASLALWSVDQALTPTTGYGVDYGSWLIDEYANFYRVAGVVSIPETDPEDVEVQLFYATNTGLKRYSAAITYPDAAGNWEFNYLSPEAKYYVALVPPTGYKPELMGPYDPEQA